METVEMNIVVTYEDPNLFACIFKFIKRKLKWDSQTKES